jgi:peroxiredoxin Q/BCP
MVAVGDVAPGFTLEGYDGSVGERGAWSLSQFRGRPVVLVFYPADNTPVCTRQLQDYTKEIAGLSELGAQVLAISPQDVDSHESFSSEHGFAFPLLADTDKEVARQYGVLGLLDLYRRCTFLVDSEGCVRWLHRYIGPGTGFRSADELIGLIASLD